MVKRLFSVLACALVLTAAPAAEISEQQALSIARQFLSTRHGGVAAARLQCRSALTAQGAPGYYVVNRGEEQGFVVVAADDRAPLVLGYSTEGSLQPDKAPLQVRQWLQGYADEMDYIRQKSAIPSTSASSQKYTPVAPLLGQTAWNQGYPYNLLTPCYVGTTHAATGCAATAMAQIFYFHRYPEHGLGQTSYRSGQYGMNLSLDFTQSTYDWDHMQPTYGDWDAEQNRQAVAVLMRDCGYAISMDYGAVSGAAPDAWPTALIEHFGYDRMLSNRSRDNYSLDEWNSIIRSEIDAGRPVFAGGFANSGGHAFVMDGYDADGLFHLNWGWGGVSNGYFRTSALTPAIQGTGGADGGFNSRQTIITGIRPAVSGSELTPEFLSSEKVQATPTQGSTSKPFTLKLTGKVTNAGWCDATVDFGFGIYDAHDQLVLTIPAEQQDQLLEKGSFRIGLTATEAVLSTLGAGQYRVFPIVVEHGGQQWTRVHDNNNSKPNYLKLLVDSNAQASFTSPSRFVLSASGVQADHRIYQGVKTSISATLTNSGDMEYSSDIRVTLYDALTRTPVAQSDNYLEEVYAQDSVRVSIVSAYDVPEGHYLLALTDENQQPLNELTGIDVLAAPEGDGTAEAIGGLQLPDEAQPTAEHVAFTARMHATSGVFAAHVVVYIYDEYETTTQPLGSLSSQFVFIEPDSTVQVLFEGSMENGIPGTVYKATLVNLDENTYIQPRAQASCLFTLGGEASAIGTVKANTDSGSHVVFNLNGQRTTGQLKPGIYVVDGRKTVVR